MVSKARNVDAEMVAASNKRKMKQRQQMSGDDDFGEGEVEDTGAINMDGSLAAQMSPA